LAELDDALRQQFSIEEDVTGVVVTEVEAGSSAEEKRVMAGDVIKEVAQEGCVDTRRCRSGNPEAQG
jgi:serine protease Do